MVGENKQHCKNWRTGLPSGYCDQYPNADKTPICTWSQASYCNQWPGANMCLCYSFSDFGKKFWNGFIDGITLIPEKILHFGSTVVKKVTGIDPYYVCIGFFILAGLYAIGLLTNIIGNVV